MSQTEYLFTSARLGFRVPDSRDLENLKVLDMDPEVRAHFPDGALTPQQIQERLVAVQQVYREHGFSDFVVDDLASGSFAGRAGFGLVEGGDVEAGYVFLKKFWGRGLAQESLLALLDFAKRNIDAPRIIAYAPLGHKASFNVMKKAGMHYFKTATTRGVECDFYEYPLLVEDR